MNKELLFVYEPAQVPHVVVREGQVIVAFDREVELDLASRGIAYTSVRELAEAPQDNREVLEWTRKLARWYALPELKFLEHDYIQLGEQYEVATLYYLQSCVYWVALMTGVLEKMPDVRKVVIPAPYIQVPPTADPTALYKERLPVDVACLLAAKRGVAVEVLEAPLGARALDSFVTLRRSIADVAVRAAIGVLNTAVSLTTPSRPIVLFATDPWSRLEPFIKNMPDVELVMSRRAEARAMGLRAIWNARARFHHRLDFATGKVRAVARTRARNMTARWKELGAEPAFAKEFAYNGVSFWPVARQVFDAIVLERAEEDIATIESITLLFKHYGVSALLLFASTKGYNLVLARLAERLGVPGIELQHALVNDDKTLVHCRLNSRYLASYGPLINETYEGWGIEPWRLIQTGSPRFDDYARPPVMAEVDELRRTLRIEGDALNVLYGIQQIYLSLEYGNFDSYEVWDIMHEAAAAAERAGNVRMLLRPRPGKWRFNFYNRKETLDIFKGDQRLVQFENLKHLFALCDVVLTGGSTIVIEALMLHKPVILYLPHQTDHDFDRFEKAGAVLVARTPEELAAHFVHLKDATHRTALVARADEFVSKGFLNDGEAAKRVQVLLRQVARPVLRGSTVTLEPLSGAHVSEAYVGWFNDPETTHYTRHGEKTMTRGDIEEYVNDVQSGPTTYAFAMRAADGTHIGNISIQKIDWEKRTGEFAIMLGNRAYGGKGIATEAGRALLLFAFKTLGLTRVWCGMRADNAPMQRLAERLGFKQERVRPKAMRKAGIEYDVVEYGMGPDDLV